jgi:hypothetical protein
MREGFAKVREACFVECLIHFSASTDIRPLFFSCVIFIHNSRLKVSTNSSQVLKKYDCNSSNWRRQAINLKYIRNSIIIAC